MNPDTMNAMRNMAVAHLENVKQKIAELSNQKNILELEIQKLVQYYETNVKLLNEDAPLQVNVN